MKIVVVVRGRRFFGRFARADGAIGGLRTALVLRDLLVGFFHAAHGIGERAADLELAGIDGFDHSLAELGQRAQTLAFGEREIELRFAHLRAFGGGFDHRAEQAAEFLVRRHALGLAGHGRGGKGQPP